MKIHKKIGLGLLFGLLLLGYGFFGSSKVLAFSKDQVENATLEFIDRATIRATFGNTSVDFIDSDPFDDDLNYKLDGPPDDCKAEINLPDSYKTINLGKFPPSINDTSKVINWEYPDPKGLSGCIKASHTNPIVAAAEGARTYYKWIDSGTIVSVDNERTFIKSADGDFRKESEDGDSCQDRIFVSEDNGAFKGVFFELDKDGHSAEGYSHSFPGCKIYGVNELVYYQGGDRMFGSNDDFHRVAGIPVNIGDTQNANKAATNNPQTNPAGTKTSGQDDATCEKEAGGFSLTWAVCPLLYVGDSFAGELTGFFEDQLSFTVEKNINDIESTKKAWSIMKNLASAVIVIIMLIMIISQAVGGGPFDAYTVRKLLPKLVAVVILMQISWYILKWVITIVDDTGRGLADLMFAPFGGSKQMDLWSLMNNAGVSNTQAGVTNWVMLVGVIIGGVAAAPAVLAGVVAASFALIVGVLALIFRKILIILALIFVPLALIAWILPGTQRYWKLWYDNLLKALLMFPLVVAIIAGGRIFAWVSGDQTSPLLGFFFVMVGFFAPLFILPKTFKWGGQIMQSAGGAIQGFAKPVSEKTSGALKSAGERWQGYGAKKYDPNASRWKKGLRRIQSGHINVLPGPLGGERSRRLTIAKGNKWADERNEEATALVGRTQEKALAGYDDYDMDDDGKFLIRRKNAAGEYTDAAGNVVDRTDAANIIQTLGKDKASRKKASFERLTGVAAGKQSLIDIAGNDGKSEVARRAAQAAVKQLIDTHSEIELQKSRIQGGANQGKRASEVYMWRDTITNSPAHYSAINTSRPDLAPDVIESAQNRVGVRYEDADHAQTQQLNVARLHEALDRLTPEQMQQAHYGLYQDIAKTGDVGLAQKLEDKITYFDQKAGVIGANAVGSLRGGREQHVDAALGLLGPMPGAPPGAAPRKLNDVVP